MRRTEKQVKEGLTEEDPEKENKEDGNGWGTDEEQDPEAGTEEGERSKMEHPAELKAIPGPGDELGKELSAEIEQEVEMKDMSKNDGPDQLFIKRGKRVRISRVPPTVEVPDIPERLTIPEPEVDGFGDKYVMSRQPLVNEAGKKMKIPSRDELTSLLFPEKEDLEETPEERRARKRAERLKPKPKKKKFSIPFVPGYRNRTTMFPAHLKKFKAQPLWKVEGTWNYLFGGMSGALCILQDSTKSTVLNAYLGTGRTLRTFLNLT